MSIIWSTSKIVWKLAESFLISGLFLVYHELIKINSKKISPTIPSEYIFFRLSFLCAALHKLSVHRQARSLLLMSTQPAFSVVPLMSFCPMQPLVVITARLTWNAIIIRDGV